jgi:uncharacterized membrane protein (DUF4010 family)
MDEPLLYRLAVALGIGVIVGIERGWKTRDQHGGRRPAGIRTFTLAALFGGVLAAISTPDRYALLAAGALVLGALVIVGYFITARESRDFGMTTELALLTTYGLGAVAVRGAPFDAAAAGVVMTLALGLKTEMHAAIERLDRRELLATLQLVAIAAVLVPLLPQRNLGPWEAINPRVIGMLVLLIAAVSYAGYFAVRVLGARLGIMLTAFFGGLTSSTAITVAYARRARDAAADPAMLGAGIVVAAATMVPRLAIEIGAVNASLLPALWPPLAALAAIPLIGAAWIGRRRSAATPGEIRLANPLQLQSALGFGLLLSAFFIAAEALRRWLGDSGVYAMAAAAGLADVDAIGLTLARAAGHSIAPTTAARAIVLATLVNTAVKASLAALLGGARLLRSASLILGVALAGAATIAAATMF